MNTIEININRLHHLLALFKMQKGDLIQLLNEGRSQILEEKDVFTHNIKESLLKKVDKVFNKGLEYYLYPADPIQSKESSIFFRKDNFNASLNLSAKRIVNQYEEEKITFSTLAKLSDFQIKRQLPVYKVSDKPATVAAETREVLYPKFKKDSKAFLKLLIENCATNNILVFEHVDHPSLTEKPNINGFYLTPNVIVLKKQKYLKREIFTLAHELGHYLLNEEEIDENVIADSEQAGLSNVENWCNDFAYYFLAGEFAQTLTSLQEANAENDYQNEFVEQAKAATQLSGLALYTRMLKNKKLKGVDYKKITADTTAAIRRQEEEDKVRMEAEKQKALAEGKLYIVPIAKPIISPLYATTLKSALFSGQITEMEFCKKLHIKPEKLDTYLQ